MLKMLPNIFTIFRLVIAAISVPLYIYAPSFGLEIIFPLYTLACISDYWDGKIARKYNIITQFGKCFDIIADKALVLAILLISLHLGSVHIIFAFIILLREFMVSGLREVLSEENIKIPASKIGKLKTGFQMVACGFAVGQYSNITVALVEWTRILAWVVTYVQEITFILFVISSFLTIWSATQYIKGLFFKKV